MTLLEVFKIVVGTLIIVYLLIGLIASIAYITSECDYLYLSKKEKKKRALVWVKGILLGIFWFPIFVADRFLEFH